MSAELMQWLLEFGIEYLYLIDDARGTEAGYNARDRLFHDTYCEPSGARRQLEKFRNYLRNNPEPHTHVVFSTRQRFRP